MSTLQAVSSGMSKRRNHGSYSQNGGTMKNIPVLLKNFPMGTDKDSHRQDREKSVSDTGSRNLESMYFRAFRSRPLLNKDEELRLATRLYHGTMDLRLELQKALLLTNKIKGSKEVESVREVGTIFPS